TALQVDAARIDVCIVEGLPTEKPFPPVVDHILLAGKREIVFRAHVEAIAECQRQPPASTPFPPHVDEHTFLPRCCSRLRNGHQKVASSDRTGERVLYVPPLIPVSAHYWFCIRRRLRSRNLIEVIIFGLIVSRPCRRLLILACRRLRTCLLLSVHRDRPGT